MYVPSKVLVYFTKSSANFKTRFDTCKFCLNEIRPCFNCLTFDRLTYYQPKNVELVWIKHGILILMKEKLFPETKITITETILI